MLRGPKRPLTITAKQDGIIATNSNLSSAATQFQSITPPHIHRGKLKLDLPRRRQSNSGRFVKRQTI